MNYDIEEQEARAKEVVKTKYIQSSLQWQRLLLYIDLLSKHTKVSQIISRADLDIIWHRHVLDCAQLIGYFRKSDKTLTDLGSGNGFPGMLLAIMRPEMNFILCDSNQSKCEFLEIVSRETICKNVRVVNCYVDSTLNKANKKSLKHEGFKKADIIVARAFGSISKCFYVCQQLINNKGQILLPRGKNWQREWHDFKSMDDREIKKTVEVNNNGKEKPSHRWRYGRSLTSEDSAILVLSSCSDYKTNGVILTDCS